ncbi:hypothetical protein GCM10010123_41520 [Pilimelia anulata]|uniref:Uncharacterized protein n=1 Tax=Pilimelia anulata TaxID=53371 RepID=A0A8J3BBL5_9ACTN|nr:hypothetical protein [Pilimelia anulata]GGK07326.1 hypothetical protein GCM10010123_41520 [Pilimelia anulata]
MNRSAHADHGPLDVAGLDPAAAPDADTPFAHALRRALAAAADGDRPAGCAYSNHQQSPYVRAP